MNKIITLLLTSVLMFSCNTNSSENSKSNAKLKEACKYRLKTEDLKFEWTAFKTTEKIAVKGSFDDIQTNSNNTNASIMNVLIGSEFKINLNSINSGNTDRDSKLINLFFQNLSKPDIITGIVEECDGDNNKGKTIINLLINNISHQVRMNYKLEENIVKLNGGLDLLNWKAEKSLNALHEACLQLHTGKDGISKTWSVMDINIEIPVKIECK